LKSTPFTKVEQDFDACSTTFVDKVVLVKPLPEEISDVAFDAVNNLRASLDQAGYAVSVAAGGKGKDTYFPFGATAMDVASKAACAQRKFQQICFG
jgi:hypothetical protein